MHKRNAGKALAAWGGLLLMAALGAWAGAAAPLADPFALPTFERVWTRTDWLVKYAGLPRAWYWGPEPGRVAYEQFDEAPGHVRQVQYFDKSRMEPNALVLQRTPQPTPPPDSQWAVTNGLLVVEMISGEEQLGISHFVPTGDANIPVASDGDDPTGPTYTTFRGLATTPVGNHPADDHMGATVIATILNRAGQVQDDPSKAGFHVTNVHYVADTHHNIPGIFWAFLNQQGPVRQPDGTVTTEQLTDPWFFATGLPISEAYWARAKIAGQQKDILIQAFERRILTYNPTNPAGFQVEVGNVGAHYVTWRYPHGLPGPVPTHAP